MTTQWPPPTAAPVPPQPTRRRLLPRSLTSRLVAGVVALVVILVLAISAGTYFALQSFLMNRLDQQLQSTVTQNPIAIGQPTEPDVGPLHGPQQLWVVLLDPSGQVAFTPTRLSGVATLNLSGRARTWLVDNVGSPRTVTTSDGQHLRIQARGTIFRGEEVLFVAGLSTDEVTRTLHRLIGLEVLIGSAAVAVAFVASSYGVRRSLRRLHGVTGTAREVTAELSPTGAGLDRRVPIYPDDEGTEVGQLAESMNTLLAAVETQFAARVASEARMRQFLADASHELRTPLTSIRGYAELARMQREQHGVDVPDPGNLERIEYEGTRMSRLVDDLLTLARSDQASTDGVAIETQPVDVAEVLDDAVEGVRAAHPERTITVAAQDALVVQGDHDALLRVVSNLVTNAVVHTGPDGPVDVRGFRDGHYAVLQVIDAGPGLPPEEAAHVFERFWRADKARSRARGGSGLGLAIVAATVQAHGGLVRFDSTVQDGSTVTVWLPCASP